MECRQVDSATISKKIEIFRVCRTFYADHCGNTFIRVRVYFQKDMSQILSMHFRLFLHYFVFPLTKVLKRTTVKHILYQNYTVNSDGYLRQISVNYFKSHLKVDLHYQDLVEDDTPIIFISNYLMFHPILTRI